MRISHRAKGVLRKDAFRSSSRTLCAKKRIGNSLEFHFSQNDFSGPLASVFAKSLRLFEILEQGARQEQKANMFA